MIVLDLILLFLLFIFQIAVFFFLQILFARVFPNKDLLYTAVFTAFLSVLLGVIVSYFTISQFFSTSDSYILSAFGSGLATIFAAGLYTFLGPVTADRSLASHMLVLLYNMPESQSTREDIYPRFNPNNFVEKRIQECKGEDIIIENNDDIILTEKGKKFAKVYIFLLRTLRLSERKEFVPYFRND